MTDFSKILEQAKDLQNKMKESQDKIKELKVEGISGGGKGSCIIALKKFLNFFICFFWW